MALRERNSAPHWAATRPEDNTPAVAVAVGHFVQVGLATVMGRIVVTWAHHARSAHVPDQSKTDRR